MADLNKLGMHAPVVVTACFGANAAIADAPIFVSDGYYELIEARENHQVLGTDGGAVDLDLVKCNSGEALADGESMLATLFNLKATADTPVVRTQASGLHATRARLQLNPGDRIDLDFQGTLTALAGVSVTLVLKRIRFNSVR